MVSPARILEGEIEVSTRDAKIDVSHDFNRVRRGDGPTYIDGLEVTYHVPFTGDRELFKCRPSTITMNPPRAVLKSSELAFPYDSPDRDLPQTKPLFQNDLRAVKQWLEGVNQHVTEFNASLERTTRERIAARRAELEREKGQIVDLGYNVRGTTGPVASTKPAEPVPARRQRAREKARREFDVALSFAGEDRDYVEQVAEGLRSTGISVFYDRFEQVNLWGNDLAEHLGEVYGKNSRYVVLFLSSAYASKAWPQHEKRFALGRLLASGTGRILPVRFDDTEIQGLAPTISYLDLRVLTPDRLVELIRQKIDAPDPDA